MTVPYTVFKEEVGKGNVKAIYSRGDSITGRFATPSPIPLPAPRDQDKTPSGDPKAKTKRAWVPPIDPPTTAQPSRRRCPPLQTPAWRHS